MPESPLLFSSVVPACGFCLQSAVEKSRSARARAGRQMGRWADRCRGIGHPLPTARDGPQAGRWRRAPQPLDSSTYRLRNRGNKARMSMKTNSREVEKSRSRGVREQGQVGRWAGGQIVVEESDTHCRPQGTDRRPEDGAGLLNLSTPQLIDRKIRGTKRECL